MMFKLFCVYFKYFVVQNLFNPLLAELVKRTYVDVWQLKQEFSIPAFIVNLAMVQLKCITV